MKEKFDGLRILKKKSGQGVVHRLHLSLSEMEVGGVSAQL